MVPKHLKIEGVDTERGISFEWSHHWFLWLLGRALMLIRNRHTWQIGWRMALRHGMKTRDGKALLLAIHEQH